LWKINEDEDVWEVEFRTSAGEFKYCPIYGQFQRCNECLEKDEEGECNVNVKYEIMTDDDIIKLTEKFPVTKGMDSKGMCYLVVDATGHEYMPCIYDGGCVVCYPCNHEKCY
jgi:hypothetical protein